MFRVGQKVVCVDAGPSKNDGIWSPLTERAIYEIIGFDTHADRGLLLAGIVPKFIYLDDLSPIGFDQRRFRPIVQRTTDISIFTDMLIPSDEKIGASA